MAQLPTTGPPAPDPAQGRARYEGAWARLQLFEEEPDTGVLQYPDAEHRTPGGGPVNPSTKAPTYADVGQFGTDIVPGGVDHEGIDPPAVVPIMDRTTPGHAAGYVGNANTDPLILQEAHDYDEGAALRDSFDHRVWENVPEHYYDLTLDGSPPPAITARITPPYGRGVNSAPANNAGNERNRPGRTGVVPRPGVYHWHGVNREFSPPRVAHDFRWVRPDVVTHIGDAPPPTNPDRYSSPFSSLERFRTDLKSRPMLRRVPAPFDEDLIYDGSEAPAQAAVDTGW